MAIISDRYLGFQIDDNGWTASQEIWVDFDDTFTIAQQLKGGWQTIDGDYVYLGPAICFYIPTIVVRSVQINWEGKGNRAQLMVQYGKRDKQDTPGSEQIDEISVGVSVETITFPNGDYEWSGGDKNGKPLSANDVQPAIQVPNFAISLKRKGYAFLPLNELFSTVGRMNADTLLGAFSPGTAIMLGAESDFKQTNEGNDQWDIAYKILVKPYGVDKFFDGTGFSQIQKKGGGPPLIESAAFSSLLG